MYLPLYAHKNSTYIYAFAVVTNEGFGENFHMQSKSASQGLPYDFSSVMHIRHNAFSNNECKSTVVPHNCSILKTILGSSHTATKLDFLHLNLFYCGGKEDKVMYCCAFDAVCSTL